MLHASGAIKLGRMFLLELIDSFQRAGLRDASASTASATAPSSAGVLDF
jgi:hypothetical protein